MKHEKITEKIINAAYIVHGELGWGFLEKVYQKAMKLEMERLGLGVATETPITVYYRGEVIGDYVADLTVEDKVIAELKSVKTLNEAHEAQLLNYLKATHIEVGLLINFGGSVKIIRKVFDNSRKKHLRH